MNERRRELERIRRDKFSLDVSAGELLDIFRVNPQTRSPIAIPAIRFTRRQAK